MYFTLCVSYKKTDGNIYFFLNTYADIVNMYA
jgi:hypothetical protein